MIEVHHRKLGDLQGQLLAAMRDRAAVIHVLSKLCVFFIFPMHYIVFVLSLSRTIHKHHTFVRCCLSFQAFKFTDELAVLHSSHHMEHRVPLV